jgi:hypothetical protein
MQFLVPEYQPGNHYYFAGNGIYDSTSPIQIPGFELWVSVSSLDTLSSPVTVIAIESPGDTASFYPITFPDGLPSISDMFELSESPKHSIFFVSTARFVVESSTKPFIQVPNNDWSACRDRFQILAAFYRLSIVTSLSNSLFTSSDTFDSLCRIFCETYRVSPPVESALASIFSELVFALDLFGFMRPATLAEANEIDAAFSIVNGQSSVSSLHFAFGDLRSAIARFNTATFPSSDRGDRLDRAGYVRLQGLVAFVRSSLSSMGLIPDRVNLRKALSEAIVRFQRGFDIPSWPCDPFTLRHIWNATMPVGCDLTALCRLADVAVVTGDLPVFAKPLEPIDIGGHPELRPMQTVLNHILSDVLSHSEAAEWIIREGERVVGSQIDRFDEVAQAAKEVGAHVLEMEQKLEETSRHNGKAALKFAEATRVLDDILTEHSAMLDEFTQIQTRVRAEQDGNNVLLAVVIVIAIAIVVYFFR